MKLRFKRLLGFKFQIYQLHGMKVNHILMKLKMNLN